MVLPYDDTQDPATFFPNKKVQILKSLMIYKMYEHQNYFIYNIVFWKLLVSLIVIRNVHKKINTLRYVLFIYKYVL